MPHPTPTEFPTTPRGGVLAEYRALTPSERRIWRAPLMWAATLVILFIPLLYVGIYLASVWDPYGNLGQLPVAFVNADAGTVARGQTYHLGRDLADTLHQDPPVKLIAYPSEEAAREAVRRGDVYFALSLPRDFSEKALAAHAGDHGELRLYSAPGASYFASRVGSAVAQNIASELNANLGSARWEVVQASLGEAQRGLHDIKDATKQLRDGAGRLERGAGNLAQGAQSLANGAARAQNGAQQLGAGAETLAGGVTRLTEGTARLSGGLRQLEAAAPGAGQLAPLQQGAAQVARGSARLAEGLGQLGNGAQQLAGGAGDLAQGAAGASEGAQTLADHLPRLTSGPGQVKVGAQILAQGNAELAAGARALQSGAATLASKTGEAARGAADLTKGAEKLQNGVNTLAAGNAKIKGALGQVVGQLPQQRDLEGLANGANTLSEKAGELARGVGRLSDGAKRLANGAGDVQDGAGTLRSGLSTLYDKVPGNIEQLGGDPAGLSVSVQVVEDRAAQVANNGAAFAPYFVTLALWVGCVLTTFIFPYLLLPESGRHTSQLARVLRKFSVPAAIVVAQALIVVAGLHFMGVTFLHPGLVVLTVVSASLTFMLLILALNLLLGAAGRLLALVLLVVQLGASGGSFPVELSPAFFQRIHAAVPATDVIGALRGAMFGAYEGQYGVFMTRMLLVALVSFALALLGRRRWQFTPDDRFRSPIITDVG